MSHRQIRYVLDASALIAFLTAEEGGLKVAQLISDARYKQTTLHITAVNLFEVYYDYLKRGATTEEAQQLLNEIYGLPITIANTIDRPLLEKAVLPSLKKRSSSVAVSMIWWLTVRMML